MSSARTFDFDGTARAALSQAHDLLPRWFPAGRRFGREFVVGDLAGTPGESLSINTETGQWSDFATDDRGGDLISLFAAINRVSQIEAGKQLAEMLGSGAAIPTRSAPAAIHSLPTPESPEWDGILPIPQRAPPPPKAHPVHGVPVHIAEYRDRQGRIIALIYRCEPAGARKQILPLTFCRRVEDGREEWRWQSLPKPRSLYHAELLDQRPKDRVLLVEGELKCDAAQALLGERMVCMSWLGGAKAWRHVDWSMLAGRHVVIWPDADEPGRDAAKQIQGQLTRLRATVRVLDVPASAPQGWDIGDAVREEWSADRVMAFVDPPVDPLPLVFFDDIKPSYETLDFVEGVLIEKSAIVLYGESNSGKTFFATDLALHIAAGMTWRNREVLQGGVVYVALEGSVGFRNRVEAWRREFTDDQRVVFAAIPVSVNLLDPDADTPRLINAVREASFAWSMPVRLIVIDTLSRAMAGGNENAPDDMGALVMNMDAIRAATGAAVLFIHHSGKDQAKGARGHSLLRAAIDTEIEVAVDEAGVRAATIVKQRELEKGSVFGFNLKVVELGTNKRGKPVTSCVVAASDGGHTAGAVPSPKVKGHPRRALEMLHDLLAESGKGGFAGVPDGYPSVPEDWWRQRFYDRTISDGADIKQDSRRAAFNRASSDLQEKRLVGVFKGRVWAIRGGSASQTSSQTESQT